MADETTEPTSAPAEKGGLSKKQRGAIVLVIIILAGAFFGLRQWVRSKTHIETDNAFVESHIHSVASRIPALVQRVAVVDNQFVHKGDLLVELDPADYQARLKSAAASLEMARNETSGDYAEVESARANVGLASARLDQANLDLKRAEALYAKEVIPREQLDRARTAHKVALAQVREAQEAENRAKAMIGMSGSGSKDARIAQKQGELETAKLNLSYARIVAPSDGYVTRKGVEPGNIVQPGQALMAIVGLEDSWITANYKESQLNNVRPGQAVDFTVDGYPGRHFTGKVESIMAGTGAAFSLLPPENATGNYVKVTQRIPVRIAIDRRSDPDHLLRVGMSVVPTILTGQTFGQVVGFGH
ncbi:HlyD family secretion protein [Geomonas subterranea]|uniref:HlyD family secretion protein n=1 Tax=Geomonas subterranea TaxID=2847989 RepID=A0ABX8LJZ4_9BACT|nr:HlyD family secretion protein [Geomonas subterranea]QXE92361.1 HlyD family secretion protein [Geomonas subterranea]QXM09540.1 HlyD family secretion protein [Geomonas subterranea]